MTKYGILLNPGHNRVYFEESSKKLSECELTLALTKAGVVYSNIKDDLIGRISYLTFCVAERLDEKAVRILSRLSFAYAIFEISADSDEKTVLIPIEKADYVYIDSGISTILKYTGKTNELFTRMMINAAHLSSDFGFSEDGETINLLDPVAGKGTTLFEGIICGYNVYGVEIGQKPVEEGFAYFRKFLETEKYKHEISKEKVSGDNKSFKSKRFAMKFARARDEFKSSPKTFELISGNAANIRSFYKKNSFHLIVGDLPYGVHHGNVTKEKSASLTRNPDELLTMCVPGWAEVLMPGGTMVLAWNTFVLPREKVVEIVEKSGLRVSDDEVYSRFEHRVDQSIKRDIIVAKK